MENWSSFAGRYEIRRSDTDGRGIRCEWFARLRVTWQSFASSSSAKINHRHNLVRKKNLPWLPTHPAQTRRLSSQWHHCFQYNTSDRRFRIFCFSFSLGESDIFSDSHLPEGTKSAPRWFWEPTAWVNQCLVQTDWTRTALVISLWENEHSLRSVLTQNLCDRAAQKGARVSLPCVVHTSTQGRILSLQHHSKQC